MKQPMKTFAALALVLFAFSCSEEVIHPETAPEFAIEEFTVPLRLNVAKPRDYTVAFRVTHPDGAGAVGEVSVAFFGSDGVTELRQLPLYDDGGFVYPGNRDVIAGDGIFTNHFISDSLVFPLGDVFIQARATDNSQNSIQSDFIGALALLNAAPKVLSIDAPDTLFSGSQTLLFSVAVQDSNDIEDITTVTMRLKRGNSEIASYPLEFQSKTAADSGVFGAFFDSTFAAERDSLYILEFQAVDLSDDVSEVLAREIYLENKPPFLSEIEVPDSLELPSQGLESAFVTIHCKDPQSLADVDSVYFFSLKPDSTYANNGNPLPMVDNGLPFNPSNPFEETGDLVANDGIYSLTIFLDPTALTGKYVFSFFARDKAGHLTAGPVDSLIVFQ